MNMRWWYALKKGFANRKALSGYNIQSPQDTASLPLPRFHAMGIKALVLDFDGVLASHGETTPLLELHPLLNACTQNFKTYILSNKPNKAREAFFNQHFPAIHFVRTTKKKPYPDGLRDIIHRAQCFPHEVLLVDDRLLTGGLAACIAGTQFYLINKPLQNYQKRPIKESFFQALRKIEQWLYH